MAIVNNVIYIPLGYLLTITPDANISGSYVRISNPGDSTAYSPYFFTASTAVTLGPFNEPRCYRIDAARGTYTTDLTQSGMFTQVDDAAKRNVVDTVTSYSADGAITVGQGIAVLSKSASAGAYTLAAPVDVTDDGKTLILTSTTARAHVVTATGLIQDGVTGGAKNTATFAAFAGASITLMAIGAKWHVLSKNVVTVA